MPDPWNEVAVPLTEATISARRVNESTKWDFYWGRDHERHCLLVLRHDVLSSPRSRLPHLKGIDVFVRPGPNGTSQSLVLKLLDNSLRDIFHHLCTDVMASTADCGSEAETVAVTVARTWRWHHLLRGGGTGLLTAREQKGLLGELLILERYLLSSLSAADSLSCWLGPLGAAQDFVVGRTGIESKTCSAHGSSEVFISSEHQLDDSGVRKLFLHLSILDQSEDDDDAAFTITEVARRLRSRLLTAGEVVADRYDALLAAAGFRFEDDYSGFRFTGGERNIFLVERDFPRLTPADLPTQISGVNYLLSLADCTSFIVPPDALVAALAEGAHDY